MLLALSLRQVFSQEWHDWQWYQRWARALVVGPGAAQPAATLTIKASGHQGLCDLTYTIPHWLNLYVLRSTLGAPSHEIGEAVSATVLIFLRQAGFIRGPPEAFSCLASTLGQVEAS